jgi:hypothetical protein
MTEKIKGCFEEIYAKNSWNDPWSKSGTGSNLKETETIRIIIPQLIKRYRINSFLDLPCGDFYWMKQIQPQLEDLLEMYIGGDIVDEIIIKNNEKFSNGKFKFQTYNLLESSLPKCDLIFCRDCLVHFSYKHILKALITIKKSKSKYLLTTTFPGRSNRNIITGHWRPIDLQKFPFLLPKPLEILKENCTEFDGSFGDKSIALWEIKQISLVKFRFFEFFIQLLGNVVYHTRISILWNKLQNLK